MPSTLSQHRHKHINPQHSSTLPCCVHCCSACSPPQARVRVFRKLSPAARRARTGGRRISDGAVQATRPHQARVSAEPAPERALPQVRLDGDDLLQGEGTCNEDDVMRMMTCTRKEEKSRQPRPDGLQYGCCTSVVTVPLHQLLQTLPVIFFVPSACCARDFLYRSSSPAMLVRALSGCSALSRATLVKSQKERQDVSYIFSSICPPSFGQHAALLPALLSRSTAAGWCCLRSGLRSALLREA